MKIAEQLFSKLFRYHLFLHVKSAIIPVSTEKQTISPFRSLFHKTAWKNYFQNGGFPYAVQIEDDTIRHDYLDGIYHTVLIKDIATRKRIPW